jgi:hypothetical protein
MQINSFPRIFGRGTHSGCPGRLCRACYTSADYFSGNSGELPTIVAPAISTGPSTIVSGSNSGAGTSDVPSEKIRRSFHTNIIQNVAGITRALPHLPTETLTCFGSQRRPAQLSTRNNKRGFGNHMRATMWSFPEVHGTETFYLGIVDRTKCSDA